VRKKMDSSVIAHTWAVFRFLRAGLTFQKFWSINVIGGMMHINENNLRNSKAVICWRV